MDLSKALMVTGGDASTYHDTTLYAGGSLGAFFQIPRDSKVQSLDAKLANKIFQLVKIVSVTSFQQGCPLYWSDTTQFQVTTAVTNTGLPAGIGINVSGSFPLVNEFILMQVRGPAKIFLKSGPTTAATATGSTVAVKDTIGQVDAVSTLPTTAIFGIFGIFVEANAGNAQVTLLPTVPLVY